jgi:hypothetical protein
MKLTKLQKEAIAQYLQECQREFLTENRIGNWHLRNLELRSTVEKILLAIQTRVYDTNE